jgi:hypothetical protein
MSIRVTSSGDTNLGEVPMSTSLHDEWVETPLAEKRTTGLAENEVTGAVTGFLLLVGFVLSMVGVSSAFVLGAFYLRDTGLPFLGQFFGP